MRYIKSRYSYSYNSNSNSNINEKVHTSDSLYNLIYKAKPFIPEKEWDIINTFINTRGNNVEGNKKLKKDVYLDLFDNENLIDTRTDRKWSFNKFVSTMLKTGKGDEVDKISNIIKGVVKEKMNSNFEIVSGYKIHKYYKTDNYCKVDKKSNLGDSCMNNKDMTFLAENSDVCRLLVLKNDKDEVIGRALLWETNIGVVMDRVYTKNTEDYTLFQIYSNKNKWSRRELFTNDNNTIVNHKGETMNNVFTKELEYKPFFENFKEDEFFPFMDTFKYYIWETSFLTNSESVLKQEDITIFKMQETDGEVSLIKYSDDYIKYYMEEVEEYFTMEQIFDYFSEWKSRYKLGNRLFYDIFVNKEEFLSKIPNKPKKVSNEDDLFGDTTLSMFNPEPKDLKNVSEILDEMQLLDNFINEDKINYDFKNAIDYIIKYNLFGKLIHIINL